MVNSESSTIPDDIARLHRAWLWRRRLGITLHNTIGVLGLMASLGASAGILGRWSQLSALVSAICIAVLAFVNPRKEYTKFAKAVRVLDMAILRHQHGIHGIKELIDAVEKGEKIIGDIEDREDMASADRARKSTRSL